MVAACKANSAAKVSMGVCENHHARNKLTRYLRFRVSVRLRLTARIGVSAIDAVQFRARMDAGRVRSAATRAVERVAGGA